jgi:hypothetical protein
MNAYKIPIVVLFLAFGFFGTVSAFSNDSAPQWVTSAAKIPVKGYASEVDAVVLLNEESVVLNADGTIVTTERRVVKILQKEGRSDAVATAFYLSKFSQVKNFEAWLVTPGGTVTAFGKRKPLTEYLILTISTMRVGSRLSALQI